MGIKQLRKFIEEKCPTAIERISLRELRYYKVSVDLGFYMCKFKVAYRDRWLNGFIDLVSNLRYWDIHPIFVFDGNAPVEKSKEQKKRRDIRSKMESEYKILVEELEKYDKNGTIGPAISLLCKRRRSPDVKRIINPISNGDVDISWIRQKIEQKKWQLFNNRPEDFTCVEYLFNVLRVPYIHAPGEAEKTCAQLCRIGKCDACLTDDSDVIAYMSPVCLSNISFTDCQVDKIVVTKVLEGLDLSNEQFIDFCIMSGTDYNNNLRGIGNKGAYSLIKNCGTIDDIAKQREIDVSPLDHIRVRELLTEFEDGNGYEVPWSEIPNSGDIDSFVQEFGISLNIDRLMKKFKVKIIERNGVSKDTI